MITLVVKNVNFSTLCVEYMIDISRVNIFIAVFVSYISLVWGACDD